ncbi:MULTISPECIES: adenylosuccinate synthetase [Pseudomonas]|jgi:adenylosuccinate synthase|uniref:adenylosuccinate synthetase n=1 Tax=Pseudomonas TaxID=286 RepID=UPI00084BA034|nr:MULTISPECIES: adenylosuccinate synthetase [Pseudomonas]OKP67366.1 adenylosuccinate synthetase [Pseudomonas fluorescens]MCF5509866.1 AAA family ATPase [Pseudomonas sp. PA-3-6H]MCF5517664.1 AAA family ATPase [Pseudomonas sp. PA-3-6E]MCF5564707.1 AAA family ATPase [Pseudomonas sp. PA-3-5D]MCF5570593.1 AAA family ATPase [Pseudomonas sp. PA-3-11C]
METRQIVVISGKTCSGKSGLASLLEREFGFAVVCDRRAIDDSEWRLRVAQPDIPDRRHEAKDADQWMLRETQAACEAEKDGRPLVVDHLNTLAQVLQFRQVFGANLVHVHLYASDPTLHGRYAKRIEGEANPLSYGEVNQLKDQAEIQALKDDADVRIYTERSDSNDTLVRVAARLHLYTPPEIRCVDVLIGGQYGSEGKGNIVAYLAREYDVMIRVGGPNAGHTVASSAGPYTYHHLPSGSRDVTGRLLLGPGMTIHLPGLLKEIEECGIGNDRLFIDPRATIIEEEDIGTERGGHLVSTIASTGSGSGAAAARRILSRGKEIRLARDVDELRPYVGTPGNYHGCTSDRLEEAYRSGHSILLEGTQGSGLSIFHGDYPHVTSRDTNVAGCLAEAGISPSRIRKILMVIRPMPIRVGDPDGEDGHTSGTLKHATTFDDIAAFAGLEAQALNTAEKTSTTKRSRRVGWFEWDQFRKACALNAPTDIVLTFADYLKSSNSKARRFEQLDPDTIKFVEELERVSQAPVSLINTRFSRDPHASDLRSLIDRRNWTARSDRR